MSIWRSKKDKKSSEKEIVLTGNWTKSIYKKFHIIKELNNLNRHELNEKELNLSGVYILKDTLNNISYIGSSRYIFNEIKQSIRRYENKFNNKISIVDVYLIDNYKYAEFFEYYLIDKYKPIGNIMTINLDTFCKRNMISKKNL